MYIKNVERILKTWMVSTTHVLDVYIMQQKSQLVFFFGIGVTCKFFFKMPSSDTLSKFIHSRLYTPNWPSPDAFNTVIDLRDAKTRHFFQLAEAWRRNMTKEQQEIVKDWTSGFYSYISKTARIRFFPQNRREYLVHHREQVLHAIITIAPKIPFNTILWRGISLNQQKQDKLAATKEVIVTTAPQSWTLDANVAASWRLHRDDPCLFGLYVPLGSRFAILNPLITTDDYHETFLGGQFEYEVLIPRDSRLQLVAVYDVQQDDMQFKITRTVISADGTSNIVSELRQCETVERNKWIPRNYCLDLHIFMYRLVLPTEHIVGMRTGFDKPYIHPHTHEDYYRMFMISESTAPRRATLKRLLSNRRKSQKRRRQSAS